PQLFRVHHGQGGAHRKPQPAFAAAERVRRIAKIAFEAGQTLSPAVMKRAHMAGAAFGDGLQLLLSHLEQALIGAKPEPAPSVGDDGGDLVVIKPVLSAHLTVVLVLEPTD